MLFIRMASRLVQDQEMTLSDWRVLMGCVVRVQPMRGLIEVHQSELARELRMHPSAVSKAIHRLVQRNVLLRGGRHTFHLNPDLAFRGELKNRPLAQKRYHTVKTRQAGIAEEETPEGRTPAEEARPPLGRTRARRGGPWHESGVPS